MPQYGQSPWEGMGDAMSGAGTSMARIALAQQMGRQRAQQQMQQMALERAYLQIAQQEANAKTGQIQQDMSRTTKMDDLAQQVAGNMFQRQIPGGVGGLLGGSVNTPGQMREIPMGLGGGLGAAIPNMEGTGGPENVGPTQANAETLNQGDLVRNAVQLMGMSNPALLERMMEGVNVGPNQVNRNLLTGDITRGMGQIETPYQQAMVRLGQDRLQQQEQLGNRRLDDYDRRNISQMHDMVIKVHQGLAKLYESQGDLDKAKEETDSAAKEASAMEDGGDEQGSKPLDAETAKAFLQKAGGDKDKARQLAKEAGYTF